MRQQIGEGTTSRVFLAIRRSDRQPFACKVVDKRLLTRDKVQIAHLLKQLRKEVDILQRLDHPNVIYLQDMVEVSVCVREGGIEGLRWLLFSKSVGWLVGSLARWLAGWMVG